MTPPTHAARATAPYEADLAAWAEAQARALHEGRDADLDTTHLAPLFEGLARERETELRARLGVILTGLLRWAEQVDLRGHPWAATIGTQRLCVEGILDECPSLRPAIADLIAAVYPAAKARAVLESALFDDSFSESCPFTDDEVLGTDFLPDPYGDDAIRGEGWWKPRP